MMRRLLCAALLVVGCSKDVVDGSGFASGASSASATASATASASGGGETDDGASTGASDSSASGGATSDDTAPGATSDGADAGATTNGGDGPTTGATLPTSGGVDPTTGAGESSSGIDPSATGPSGGGTPLDPDLDVPDEGESCNVPGSLNECPGVATVCRFYTAEEGRCESCEACGNLNAPCTDGTDCDILFSCFQGRCTNFCQLGTFSCGPIEDCLDIGHPTHGVCDPFA
ncbi:MAG: hypothetical protein AAGA54_11240 [Myxococcota bacterium]